MQILQQLGWLFFKSIPSIILFLLFFWFLRANFFEPLERTLAERNARINKARAEAHDVQAAARDKTQSYEEALRKARASVFAEQEVVRQAALDDRVELLRKARAEAQEKVRAEKERIGREFAAVRAQLQSEANALAGRIAERMLASPSPLGGSR